jgi:hypothetical protein
MRAIATAAAAIILLAACGDPMGPSPRPSPGHCERLGYNAGSIYHCWSVDESRPRPGFTYCLRSNARSYRDFNPVVWPVPFCDDAKWAEQFEERGRSPMEP